MGLLANENAISSGGYTISKSLRFRASASAYLNRTPASAGNRQKWTYSTWVKRGQLNIANGLLAANDAAVGGGSFGFNTSTGGGVADAFYLTLAGVGTQNTTALFRDPSAWYHIVVALDTTQATQADRFKLYINGTQYTFSSNIVGLNASYDFNNAIQQRIGTSGVTGSTTYADDYLSELNFIDGQALTPSSFGQTDVLTGVWTAKKYTGTYGTNGFYLPFTDTSSTTNLVKDSSGNGNNWTPNNISLTAGVTYDSMIDSPTITASGTQPVGNYAVLNPLDLSATCSLSNGNIRALVGAGTASLTRGTFSVTTGKWYWEVTVTTDASALAMIGIAKSDVAVTNANFNTANGWYYYATNGNFYTNGSGTAYGASFAAGSVIGIALDMDSNTITFYKNNVSQGVKTIAGLSAMQIAPASGHGGGTGNNTCDYNFGQRPFTYTPPTGFKALCTTNLPDSTIVKGNQYMDATTYTGNTTTVTVTNAGSFQPDLVWIKDRSQIASHVLTDAVRGATQQLFSNLTNAEQTNSAYVTAFNSNGFTVGVGNTGTGVVNNNGDSFVAWQWDAGSSTVTNTSGTISSQVRANPTAGVSVVTYTGTGANATVGHGLGVAPKMVIVKRRNAVENWPVYHASLTSATYGLLLDATNAQFSNATLWNSTAPTSTTISIGTNGATNASGGTYVAYCFAEIAGFSKFGKYTGNGSADGPFVYCGFRPKYIMIKRTDTTSDWGLLDTSRSPYNVSNAYLAANLSNAEVSAVDTDILSNGFKLRTTSLNNSGGTFIYMAFAENPFKNALAR